MFPILQVDPNSLVGDEQLGSKSKFWFEHAGERWLFKLARENTGEDWAEKVAAEVAKVVPVLAARVELADYRGRRGSPIVGVANAPVQRLLDIVDEVPNLVISEPSRAFAKALLAYTHGVLSGLAT